jgi:hypothetical protein
MRRDPSIEKLVGRAHRRVVFWRFVGDCIEVPAHILKALAEVLVTVANLFMAFSRTIFYMELHYAQQYKNLTGSDLAFAMGERNRYAGMDPYRLAYLRETERQQVRQTLQQQFDVDLGDDENES